MRCVQRFLVVTVSILAFTCSCISAEGNEGEDKFVLKVMTINVRHNSDFWEERFPLLADEIVRLRPDIIGLQEVEIGVKQSKVLRNLIKEKSAEAGKPLKYFKYEHLKTGSDMMSGEGIAIFSRYPILKKGFTDLKNGRPVLFSRVGISKSLIVDMYNTHLHHRGGDEEVRLPQAEIMTAFIESHDAGYITFLTGDMNSQPGSKTIAHLKNFGFTDSFIATPEDARSKNENTAPVYMSKTPVPQKQISRIDYVFVKPAEGGPAIHPVASEVCFLNHAENGLYPSDHLGVMTTFELSFD
ncbi:endonuclease/exonuclease/phosphatase family protein [bacterium]